MIRRWLAAVGMAMLVAAGFAGSASLTPAPAWAQAQGFVPGGAKSNANAAEMWRAIRQGVTGNVSIPDKMAGTLVQSQGDNLRAFRDGPLVTWGGWGLLITITLIAAFYGLRGRIEIDGGPAGRTIRRFNDVERFVHWLTAGSFVVLALTGLNLMYGKFVLMPIVGQPAFAAVAHYGKLAHNYLGFAFMVGIVMMVVLWIRHNIPNAHDLKWLALAGGLFTRGMHPSSKKFNAGQKLIFWAVVLGGGSMAFSGLCLMFPFELHPFDATFRAINAAFGTTLPTGLTALQEAQLALVWHGIMALVLIAIIIAHIYIGSIGMEGALDAVVGGDVDENWARQHHDLWVAEVKGEHPAGAHGHPAE